jgi:PBP1b-binding outer membrane lipoprotein LpoB
MKISLPALLFCFVLASCSNEPDTDESVNADINSLARDYLFLELSMGWHDGAHGEYY